MPVTAYSFEHIADATEIEKCYEHAVQPLAAVDTLHVRLGAPVEQVKQQANEDALTRLRDQPGDIAFELALGKGAALTAEQEIALVLS